MLLDLMLKLTNPSEFQVWEGNDFGDFQLKNHLPYEGHVTDVCFVDVNNDGLNDIVMSTNPASLQVIFNNDLDAFTDRIEYAAGVDPQNIVVTSQGNCIVFDRSANQFLVFRNAMNPSSMADSIQLATGVSPTEIIVNDFNRDSSSGHCFGEYKKSVYFALLGPKRHRSFWTDFIFINR